MLRNITKQSRHSAMIYVNVLNIYLTSS